MDEKEPYTEKLLSLSVNINMRKVHSTVSLLDPVSKVLDIMIKENIHRSIDRSVVTDGEELADLPPERRLLEVMYSRYTIDQSIGT